MPLVRERAATARRLGAGGARGVARAPCRPSSRAGTTRLPALRLESAGPCRGRRPRIAFRCVLRCGSVEDVIVIADSLLHLRLATREELAAWARDAPQRIASRLEETDAAESGLESIVRVRLRSRRLRVRAQVRIGPRRVDLVVGDRLIIECDGAEHHGGWEAQASDRARDRALLAAGYLVMRVTYRQVLDDWPTIEQEILAVVRRREHRWPRRRDAV